MRISDWSSDVCSSDLPLASPFTLGVSSAAALGAAITLVFDWHFSFMPTQYVLVFNAFALALLCTLLLDAIARRARIGTAAIVLFGIALVFTFNALLSLVQLTANAAALQDLVFWMMRSEEHTSELRSLMRISYAVFCLKKKKKENMMMHRQT